MKKYRSLILLTMCSIFIAEENILGVMPAPDISGELKKWHKVTLTFTGPDTGENDQPNPFRDYRLDVTFAKGKKRYLVPGYYAADGNAAHDTKIMFMPPNYGVLREEQLPLGCYDSWSGRLLNVHDLLDNELQRAKSNPDREVCIRHQEVEGRDKLVLEVYVTTDIADEDYLRNKFISELDHVKVYSFDAKTKLLEGLQVYVHTEDKDVLIFEVTDIEYNKEINDDVFVLDLPEDMVWYEEPEILPDNQRYEEMTPKEAAIAFFQACAEEDWEEVLKFETYSRVPEWLRRYGGLEIIEIGEPFKSDGYGGWFVPYKIKLKLGVIRKHNLALRKDNPAKRFVVDGGI